jgi:hypothetical protein
MRWAQQGQGQAGPGAGHAQEGRAGGDGLGPRMRGCEKGDDGWMESANNGRLRLQRLQFFAGPPNFLRPQPCSHSHTNTQLTRNRLGEDAIAGPVREASAGRSRNGGHFFWRVLVEKVCVCWREKKGELRGCVNDPVCESRTREIRPTMGVHYRGEWGPWSGFGGRARGRRPGATESAG